MSVDGAALPASAHPAEECWTAPTFLREETSHLGPISLSFTIFLTVSPLVIIMISKMILDHKKQAVVIGSGLIIYMEQQEHQLTVYST